MNDNELTLLDTLRGTTLYDKIHAVEALYADLARREDAFCDAFCIHCAKGCGRCCEGFTPDLNEDEALYLAFGLMANGQVEDTLARLSSAPKNAKGCPLYDGDDDTHHCTVYAHRPLICRLFGASATRGKDGHPTYKKCKWNDAQTDHPYAELRTQPDAVVTMETYGAYLEESDPEDVETSLIGDVLPKALDKIELVLELKKMNG